jgi:hypothetical protein
MRQRPHQRFCSQQCRREEWSAKQRDSSPAPAQRVLQGVERRASRDGKGTKVYLLPEEIEALRGGRLQPGVDVNDWQAAQSKLAKALNAKRPRAIEG